MYRYCNMMGWGGSDGFALITTGLFIILMVTVVMLLIRMMVRPDMSSRDHRGRHAMEILKERYAKGEISKKEFEEMKHDIS